MGNQTLGRGELWFSLFKPGTEDPAGYRYLGNSPEFNLSIENETLDHFSSDRGIREKDKSIILETTSTGSLVLDDIQLDNLALFFFGSTSTISQTSGTAVEETFTDVKQGLSYQLGVSDGNPTGVRSISNVVVEVASVAKTVNVDYTVDLELGLIHIVDGGGIADLADIDVTYDRAAKSRDQVISGTDQIKGALKFISYNPEGAKMDYTMPLVKLSPNGDFGLKSDEWQQLPLTVEILKRTARERIYIDGRPYTP